MAIHWVVFDIGGVLEVIPGGGDPTTQYPEMEVRWEARLGMVPGELSTKINQTFERLMRDGKNGLIGTCSEEDWLEELRHTTGWDQSQLDAFRRDFWDVYCGNPNPELAAYLGGLRPRYKTALLSNSFDGARREEEARLHLSEIADRIIYSHEVGVQKPDQRIFEITCERLGAQPGEIVFLDDAEKNVAAASAYGLHAILFHDNAQAIADIQTCFQADEA
jgi:putative hydrolase of the HAD superfamily